MGSSEVMSSIQRTRAKARRYPLLHLQKKKRPWANVANVFKPSAKPVLKKLALWVKLNHDLNSRPVVAWPTSCRLIRLLVLIAWSIIRNLQQASWVCTRRVLHDDPVPCSTSVPRTSLERRHKGHPPVVSRAASSMMAREELSLLPDHNHKLHTICMVAMVSSRSLVLATSTDSTLTASITK